MCKSLLAHVGVERFQTTLRETLDAFLRSGGVIDSQVEPVQRGVPLIASWVNGSLGSYVRASAAVWKRWGGRAAPAHGQAHLSGPDDDRARVPSISGLLSVSTTGSDARDQPRQGHREPIPIPRRALLMSHARLLTFEQDDLGGPPDAHPRFTCVSAPIPVQPLSAPVPSGHGCGPPNHKVWARYQTAAKIWANEDKDSVAIGVAKKITTTLRMFPAVGRSVAALIYQMAAKLLSWIVLHARSDTANELCMLLGCSGVEDHQDRCR